MLRSERRGISNVLVRLGVQFQPTATAGIILTKRNRARHNAVRIKRKVIPTDTLSLRPLAGSTHIAICEAAGSPTEITPRVPNVSSVRNVGPETDLGNGPRNALNRPGPTDPTHLKLHGTERDKDEEWELP
jgi:hypothetical protein